jgi:predicted nucleic acid-binding protein
MILEVAARLEARGGLAGADAWIAATAVTRHAVLVHRDPEFDRIDEIDQERLSA